MNNLKCLLFGVLLIALLPSCTSKNKATKALKDYGLHPISVGGWCPFSCSEDDVFTTKFTAYSSDSTRIVKGCVCQGLLKGSTVRLY